MDIRIAVPDDIQIIVDLAVAFRDHLQRARPSNEEFLASVGRLVDSPDAEFYIAIRDGTSVGYVLQRFRYSMWASGIEATIEDLFVDPAERGQGIGRLLIQYALGRARERGCTTVCLDTNENNAASTRIYGRLGFEAFSKRWNGRQVFYRLALDSSPTGGSTQNA